MKDCTILVNSCDKYEDAWNPFFNLLKKQWPDCPYDIVLSTETKIYSCDFFKVKTINSDPKSSWSARLRNTLNNINTDYVLFFLEDFFLLEKVRVDIFNQALELIKGNEEIGLIVFNTTRNLDLSFPDNTDYKKSFIKLDNKVKGRTNVLVGLWRKEYFLKLIFGDENPWEYEINSNIRARYAGYKIYSQNYDVSFPAFRYCINPKDGYGITQGKWLVKNQELFESNGIFDVNYNNLGVFETETSYKIISNQSRNNSKKNKAKQKEFLKTQPVSVVIKEKLYDLNKKFKKSFFIKKIMYFKKCMKYYKHYKNN